MGLGALLFSIIYWTVMKDKIKRDNSIFEEKDQSLPHFQPSTNAARCPLYLAPARAPRCNESCSAPILLRSSGIIISSSRCHSPHFSAEVSCGGSRICIHPAPPSCGTCIHRVISTAINAIAQQQSQQQEQQGWPQTVREVDRSRAQGASLRHASQFNAARPLPLITSPLPNIRCSAAMQLMPGTLLLRFAMSA